MPKISAKLERGHPQQRHQMQVKYADEVAENWRLSMRSVIILARSQVRLSVIVS